MMMNGNGYSSSSHSKKESKYEKEITFSKYETKKKRSVLMERRLVLFKSCLKITEALKTADVETHKNSSILPENLDEASLKKPIEQIRELLTDIPQDVKNQPSALKDHVQNGADFIIKPSVDEVKIISKIPCASENEMKSIDSNGNSEFFNHLKDTDSKCEISDRRPQTSVTCRSNDSKIPKKDTEVAGGANGIFTRRLDFSSFNSLPKIKLNSYQIKTEDEGNHGNDDTRCFILSTLASHNRSKVQCVLCEEYLLVFDRYPLVDGTFFLSPRQHAKFCIEVKVEGRTQFLTCVCMGCLEGVPGRQVYCRFCSNRWDGSSLVLGTMYSYDIFAAMPCCTERIKCNSCFKPVLHPAQRLNFFSDYSHMVPCPHCRTLDTHFVKSLPYCFIQRSLRSFSQWP